MTWTAYPNGVSSFGMPLLGSGPGIPSTTGNVYFVDSGATNATTGNTGTSPSEPMSTIDSAINKATANNGDLIIVMPGHTETITTATEIVVDVAGIQIIGLGIGHTRPKIVFNHANANIPITASNVRLSNLVLETSLAAVASGITATGTIQHIELDHLRFTFDATGVEFTAMVSLGGGATDSADYVSIHDCWFEAENIDGCASALLIDDCQFVHIQNNLFTGDFNSVAIDGAAGSSACLDYVITGNVLQNYDTGATIDLDDSATGVCANNYVFGGAALASNVDWGALGVIESYVTDAADASAVIVPVATAA